MNKSSEDTRSYFEIQNTDSSKKRFIVNGAEIPNVVHFSVEGTVDRNSRLHRKHISLDFYVDEFRITENNSKKIEYRFKKNRERNPENYLPRCPKCGRNSLFIFHYGDADEDYSIKAFPLISPPYVIRCISRNCYFKSEPCSDIENLIQTLPFVNNS